MFILGSREAYPGNLISSSSLEWHRTLRYRDLCLGSTCQTPRRLVDSQFPDFIKTGLQTVTEYLYDCSGMLIVLMVRRLGTRTNHSILAGSTLRIQGREAGRDPELRYINLSGVLLYHGTAEGGTLCREAQQLPSSPSLMMPCVRHP